MIWKNTELHGVDHVNETENGAELVRVPEKVRAALNINAQRTATFSGGVEIRFKMKSDTAKITMKAENEVEAQVAYAVYGSIQGGWDKSSYRIGTENTTFEIKKMPVTGLLERIHSEYNHPFSPEVVRIVLPYGKHWIVDIEGDIEPPAKEDTPSKTYLAYGSSITHGSMALGPLYTYPYRVSAKLGYDYINLGFPGSCGVEAVAAEYIRSRKDWDIATCELGINLIGSTSVEEFDNKVKVFCDIMEGETRPVVFTDMYTSYNDINENDKKKAAAYRGIVKKYTEGRFFYVPGNEIMTSPAHLAADFVHPNIDGQMEITDNWYEILKSKI